MLRQIVSQRLKALRTSHNLKSAHLAFFLNLPTPASISQFESALNLPKLATLKGIANLFGVSIDWLLGDSDNPFSESKIVCSENNILHLASPNIVQTDAIDFYRSTWFLRDPIAQFYINPKTRTNYSLPVRANIIFCLNVIFALTDKFPNNKDTDTSHSGTITIEKKYQSLYDSCTSILENYIIKKENIQSPIFIIDTSTITFPHIMSNNEVLKSFSIKKGAVKK